MAGREKLPNKRRVIRRINFMTTDNGTNSHMPPPLPLPLESMLAQDRIMLINKLPAIQFELSNWNMALPVLRNLLKRQQQQQVPLPNVDLFVCMCAPKRM